MSTEQIKKVASKDSVASKAEKTDSKGKGKKKNVDGAENNEKVELKPLISSENEYLSLVAKKIRSLNKKLKNCEKMDQKVAKGEPLNSEEKEVLKNKEYWSQHIKDLQKLLSEFEKIHAQGEKSKVTVPATPSKQDHSQQPNKLDNEKLRDLLTFIQVSQFFDQSEEGKKARQQFWIEHKEKINSGNKSVLNGDQDIDSLNYVANVLVKHQPDIESSLTFANKLLSNSNEIVLEGASYQLIRERANELYHSQAFLNPQSYSVESAPSQPHNDQQNTVTKEEGTQTGGGQETADFTSQPLETLVQSTSNDVVQQEEFGTQKQEASTIQQQEASANQQSRRGYPQGMRRTRGYNNGSFNRGYRGGGSRGRYH